MAIWEPVTDVKTGFVGVTVVVRQRKVLHSFYGITGHQKCIETGENDAKWWNGTLQDGIIESICFRCVRFRFHLRNFQLGI